MRSNTRASARDLHARLARALLEGSANLTVDPARSTPEASVGADLQILETLAVRDGCGQSLRLWQARRCIVVPQSFGRRAGFVAAVQQCSWPVVVRQSGGGAVMQGDHVANLSLYTVTPSSEARDIFSDFLSLGKTVLPALARLGVAARYERVPDAYCSGRYDIAVGCRKLAGTAGFVRRLGDARISVVHASIRLDEDGEELEAVAGLERAIGLKPNYRSDRITSLRREIVED